MTNILARLVISIGLLGACAFAGDTGPKTGAVQGMVFTPDPKMEAAPWCRVQGFL